jgi:hypothetical protein
MEAENKIDIPYSTSSLCNQYCNRWSVRISHFEHRMTFCHDMIHPAGGKLLQLPRMCWQTRRPAETASTLPLRQLTAHIAFMSHQRVLDLPVS